MAPRELVVGNDTHISSNWDNIKDTVDYMRYWSLQNFKNSVHCEDFHIFNIGNRILVAIENFHACLQPYILQICE